MATTLWLSVGFFCDVQFWCQVLRTLLQHFQRYSLFQYLAILVVQLMTSSLPPLPSLARAPDLLYIESSVSPKQKKIFQKEKRHSSLFWKAFQIHRKYFSCHMHYHCCSFMVYISLCCVSILVNYHFLVFFNLMVALYTPKINPKVVTELIKDYATLWEILRILLINWEVTSFSQEGFELKGCKLLFGRINRRTFKEWFQQKSNSHPRTKKTNNNVVLRERVGNEIVLQQQTDVTRV